MATFCTVVRSIGNLVTTICVESRIIPIGIDDLDPCRQVGDGVEEVTVDGAGTPGGDDEPEVEPGVIQELRVTLPGTVTTAGVTPQLYALALISGKVYVMHSGEEPELPCRRQINWKATKFIATDSHHDSRVRYPLDEDEAEVDAKGKHPVVISHRESPLSQQPK